MPLSYGEVSEILKIIDSSNCEELILELEGTRLVVRRGGNSATHSPTLAPSAPGAAASTATPAATPRPSPAAAPASAAVAAGTPAPADADAGTTVCSPMVGTFYRRPSPEEPPFAEEGASVKAGDPLALIEVMKLYTTIESPVDGVVEAVLIEDGALAEFDQPLFVIRPA